MFTTGFMKIYFVHIYLLKLLRLKNAKTNKNSISRKNIIRWRITWVGFLNIDIQKSIIWNILAPFCSLANTPKNGHHFCLPVFFTFCNCLPTFRNRPPLACANIVRGKMFNLHCLVCVCLPGLKGPCHEIFNTFLSKNSTWAPYEQAKTV